MTAPNTTEIDINMNNNKIIQIGKKPDEEIDSVSSFVKIISEFEKRYIAQWLYRGHTKSEYKLIPSLFRLKNVLENSFLSWDELEKHLIREFKREATQHLDHRRLTKIDWLCLAQHHKLPTRLLDWTRNPLIALYFATENNYESNGDVWCMGFPSTNNCHPNGTIFSQKKDFNFCDDLIIRPRHIDSRIINQVGCFTKHEDETPFDEDLNFREFFVFNRIRINAGSKNKIRMELYDMGIHVSFIYPNLDSIASRLVYEITESHFRHSEIEDI
jgi:FRG domain